MKRRIQKKIAKRAGIYSYRKYRQLDQNSRVLASAEFAISQLSKRFRYSLNGIDVELHPPISYTQLGIHVDFLKMRV